METLEDFDFTLQYHSSKANVVANTLNRKPRFILSGIVVYQWKLYDYISKFSPCFELVYSNTCFSNFVAKPTMLEKVIQA